MLESLLALSKPKPSWNPDYINSLATYWDEPRLPSILSEEGTSLGCVLCSARDKVLCFWGPMQSHFCRGSPSTKCCQRFVAEQTWPFCTCISSSQLFMGKCIFLQANACLFKDYCEVSLLRQLCVSFLYKHGLPWSMARASDLWEVWKQGSTFCISSHVPNPLLGQNTNQCEEYLFLFAVLVLQ